MRTDRFDRRCVYGPHVRRPSPWRRSPTTAPALTAQRSSRKNVAARGGLEAWRKIQTMVWIGHIETGNSPGSAFTLCPGGETPNKDPLRSHHDGTEIHASL